MKVNAASIFHVRVPLVEPFRISSGAVDEKDGIVVQLESDDFVGFGESSPMSGTFYSSDTPESCWRDLREQLIPAIIGKSFPSLMAASEFLGTLPGSNFAKAGLETAFWDLEARSQNKPLYELLGGTGNPVESGLAVGLYDNTADLLRTIDRYFSDGYKRVKIKIERGRDIELVRAVRQSFGEIPLFVDANGAYDLSDIEVFRTLDDFGLMMFEQPFPGKMLAELAELQSNVRTPVCLDESLETEQDVRQAIALGSMKIANIKIQRVGGLANALAIHEICQDHKVPVWIGTMPELGIGQAQGAALASLSGCVYPTDVEASLRWFRDDIIQPFLDVKDGFLHPKSVAGLGVSVNCGKLQEYLVQSEHFS